VLRDRLPVPEAAQLAAQLPPLIRGIYFDVVRALPEALRPLVSV
jgi:uncharacterized protein (DUF2267 family)